MDYRSDGVLECWSETHDSKTPVLQLPSKEVPCLKI